MRERALDLLRGFDCPICCARAEGEELFFSWFLAETFGQEPTIRHLQGSLGSCPRHARSLLSSQRRSVITTVYSYVVPAAGARLATSQSSAAILCPACEAADEWERNARFWVLSGLEHADVAEAYAGTGGFCWPHALGALLEAPPDTARLLGLALRARAHENPNLPFVACLDEDAPRRRRLGGALAAEDESADGTLGRLRSRLEVDSCPVCFATGLTESGYLAWAISEGLGGARDELVSLCPRHLHDVAQLDHQVAAAIVQRRAEEVFELASGLISTVETLPAPPLTRLLHPVTTWRSLGDQQSLPGMHWSVRSRTRHMRRVLTQSRARTYHGVVASLAARGRPSVDCAACRALLVSEARQLELLVVGLEDATTARAFAASSGLCARHALALKDRSPLARQVTSARLALLGWELDEAVRKRSWSFRHETVGPESSAWLRAPAVLDGSTYLGLPAPGGLDALLGPIALSP